MGSNPILTFKIATNLSLVSIFVSAFILFINNNSILVLISLLKFVVNFFTLFLHDYIFMLKFINHNFTYYLCSLFPVETSKTSKNEIVIFVLPEILPKAIKILRLHTQTQFKILTYVSCVDYPESAERFQIVYEFVSLTYNRKIRVKTPANAFFFVFSLTEIFPAANWWEREICDLFGVFFVDHPDLRRILTDYGFEGHPLRKCFPLYGYVEVYYSESRQRVVCKPVKQFPQEFKNLKFFDLWLDSV